MKDDAIAPVIAVMLILAAIVTFFSIWNAIYVPSMKESSEVEHIQNVESSFQKFSSDIDYAVSSHQDYLTFSEPVQLGGGDVMVNLLKSSGTISVRNEDNPIYNLTLTNTTGVPVALLNGTIVNFSYESVGNFWQDQGYQWQYGYLNVTKNDGELKTPLSYYNMTDVSNSFSNPKSPLASLASSFGKFDYTINTTQPSDNSTDLGGNCSSLNIWAVNISASPDHHFISSNGEGTLSLTTAINETSYIGVSNITLSSDNGMFENVTANNWDTNFIAVENACPGDVGIDPENPPLQLNITQTPDRPVTVVLYAVNIQVSAY
jgi:hypothetical protein